jgi:hypothetical protein
MPASCQHRSGSARSHAKLHDVHLGQVVQAARYIECGAEGECDAVLVRLKHCKVERRLVPASVGDDALGFEAA